jgi:integrase
MGYIRKKDNGYAYTVSLGLDPKTMKYKQKSKGGFKTKKECQIAMIDFEARVNKGEYFKETKLTLEAYLKQWLENIKHNITESTYEFYKNQSKILSEGLGNVKIDKLKGMQIQSFLTSKINDGLVNNTTVRHYYNVLNIALNQAVKWQLIQSNPCVAVEAPRPRKAQIEVLKPDEVLKLLEYTKTSEFKIMYMPLLLATTCGMRRGEVLGLQWEDIDLENKILRVRHSYTKVGKENKLVEPKTDLSIRTIALLPYTVRELQQYKDQRKVIKLKLKKDEPDKGEHKKGDFVCCWEDGSPILPDYASHTL